jgi:hydroxyethylthiazole kinase-like sugar kinase family protein
VLHLIEVTAPFGYGNIEWQKDENNDDLLYETAKITRNCLEVSKARKEQKCKGIEASARKLLEVNKQSLRNQFHLDDVNVEVDYVVVSSLGVIPKDTHKTIRKITGVRDRDSSQTANLMAKRMSIAAIKRSHEIYTNTVRQDDNLSKVIEVDIEQDDDNEEIKNKQFDVMQLEISS